MGRVRLISWSDFLDLCVQHANRFSRKVKSITDGSSSSLSGSRAVVKTRRSLTRLLQGRKSKNSDDDFGDGGVWQRSILMGDKCQPLAFSGVIYYDCNGKQLNEVPVRSPRASPYPVYAGAGR